MLIVVQDDQDASMSPMTAWLLQGQEISTAQTVGCLIEVFLVISKFPVLNLELEHINMEGNTFECNFHDVFVVFYGRSAEVWNVVILLSPKILISD